MHNFIHQYVLHPALWLTLKATLVALILQLLLGIPVGLYLAGKKSMMKQIIVLLVTLPMIFPPMALGFFLLLMLGKNGLIGHFLFQVWGFKLIFSYWGILIAVFTVGFPFMVKSVQAAREQLDSHLVEAAQTLGKSPWQTLVKVILPNIKGGILAGVLLAFGRGVGEVGISLMLGGNIIGRTETLSLAIYNAVFEGDFKKAIVFSVLLSVIAIMVLVILNLVNRERKYTNQDI